MKITVINGNMHHGSTWHCKDQFMQELARYGSLEVSEFSLPKDMPHFCTGCFSCIYNGEQTCPHAVQVSPIVEALLQADVIVMTSPVYGMDVSGQLKALLDHLCFMWMSHRPNPGMFQKVGVTFVTTAGVGAGHTTKTMRNSLKFWGVKRLFSFKYAVAASKWSEVSDKKLTAIKKETAVMAKRVAKAVERRNKLSSPLFTKFFFTMMTGMMKKNTWNSTDRNHWQTQGWLSGSKPF